MVVKEGRFGPYVTDGETNASLREGDTVEAITLERAAELLQDRRARGPATPRRARGQEGHRPRRHPPRPRSARPSPSLSRGRPPEEPPVADEPATTEEVALTPGDQLPERRSPSPRRGTERRRRPDRPGAGGRAVADDDAETRGPRLLGSTSFFRLWLAQVVSSLGDWIGLVAILSLTARVGGSSPEAAIALVMSARMIPGFFLASLGGVLVDRWDRKKVMVICDIGRGLVLATLPFVDTVWGLFLASLVLEMFTLLWSPAKEASVPNLVQRRQAARRPTRSRWPPPTARSRSARPCSPP